MDTRKLAALAASAADLVDRVGVRASDPVVVAMSGGKDSVVTALVLREIGFDVTAAMVDMHYSTTWAARVLGTLNTFRIPAEVVSAHRLALQQAATRTDLALLPRNLDNLEVTDRPLDFTPCTSCYNSKVLSLREVAAKRDAPYVAFGHHGTDAASSLLKAALMYVDRWDHGNSLYDPARFRGLCVDFVAQLRSNRDELLSRATQLVVAEQAATDEPPIQDLVVGDGSVKIVRPLFAVWESEVVCVYEPDDWERVESSGCGHTALESSQTAREIVHFEIMRELEQHRDHPALARLRRLVDASVMDDGYTKRNTRRRREDILGPTYKPSITGIEKL